MTAFTNFSNQSLIRDHLQMIKGELCDELSDQVV